MIGRILGRAGCFLWEGFNPRSLSGLQEGVSERRSQKNPWQEYNYLQQNNTAEYNTLLETLHSLKVHFIYVCLECTALSVEVKSYAYVFCAGERNRKLKLIGRDSHCPDASEPAGQSARV